MRWESANIDALSARLGDVFNPAQGLAPGTNGPAPGMSRPGPWRDWMKLGVSPAHRTYPTDDAGLDGRSRRGLGWGHIQSGAACCEHRPRGSGSRAIEPRRKRKSMDGNASYSLPTTEEASCVK